MMISSTSKCFENKEEEERKINWTIIKKFMNILLVLLIIFTLIFFTILGCFFVWNESTSRAAQTVTLSSEGGVDEMYPDKMGEYQLAEEERRKGFIMFSWARLQTFFLFNPSLDLIQKFNDPFPRGSFNVNFNWYRHKDKEDIFLKYNNLGNIVC